MILPVRGDISSASEYSFTAYIVPMCGILYMSVTSHVAVVAPRKDENPTFLKGALKGLRLIGFK